MKKRAVFLLAAACGCLALGIVGCGEEAKNAHEHDWGEWTVTTPSTCSKKGEEVRVCKTDPTHTETRPIEFDPDAHDFRSGDKCADCKVAKYTLGLSYELTESGDEYQIMGIGAALDKDLIFPLTYAGKPVTKIFEFAFENQSQIESVTIPRSITYIGYKAFEGCDQMSAVYITDLAAWCGISFGANPLTNAHILFLNGEKVTHLDIPSYVSKISGNAFEGMECLESVTIPEGVTAIEGNAFAGCGNLESVTVPQSVTTIGNYAFMGCKSLKSVTLPENLMTICNGTFYGCSSLSEIVIPEGVMIIETNAFAECPLKSITIPRKVFRVSSWAFYGCTLLESVTFEETQGWKRNGKDVDVTDPKGNVKMIMEMISDTSGFDLERM